MQQTRVGERGVWEWRELGFIWRNSCFFFQVIFSRLPCRPLPEQPPACSVTRTGALRDVWFGDINAFLLTRSTKLCQSFHLSKLTRPPGPPETRPLTHSLSPCAYNSIPVSARDFTPRTTAAPLLLFLLPRLSAPSFCSFERSTWFLLSPPLVSICYPPPPFL